MRCRLAFLAVLLVVPGALLLAQASSVAGDRGDIGAVRRLLRRGSPSERAAAVRRLAGCDERGAEALVLDCLADPHPYVRRAAAGVLGIAAEGVRPRLARALGRLPDVVARAEGCRALALWADEPGRAGLVGFLEDRDPAVRCAAVEWLAEDPSDAVLPLLRGRLLDRDGLVRATAIDALVRRGAVDLQLAAFARDSDWRARSSALEGSVVGTPPLDGGSAAAVAVLHGLDDAVWSVRLLAAELSRRVPDRRLLPALVRTLSDDRWRVATTAHASLVALTGIPFDPDPARWAAWLAAEGSDFDPAARESRDPPKMPRHDGQTVAAPRFMGLAVESRHVGFVLDASGSMAKPTNGGESRWERACRELASAIEAMGSCSANVFLFRDGVERAFKVSVPMTKARRGTLARWLEEARPSGRTALYDGIAAALEDPDLDTVLVLSDGAPSAGLFFTKTDLLGEIRRKNRWRRARIDVVSIGGDGIAARWRGVLRRLAEDSGGTWVRR